MTQDEYVRAVMHVLSQHTERAAAQLSKALELLPEKSKDVTIDIMVDQGVEGFLTVQVGVNGPDLYVLNKAIALHAKLFDTVMIETAMQPDLPLMDINEDAFSVGDVLTDCGAKWATEVWEKIKHEACRLPVNVTSPEGYGTCLPICLQR